MYVFVNHVDSTNTTGDIYQEDQQSWDFCSGGRGIGQKGFIEMFFQCTVKQKLNFIHSSVGVGRFIDKEGHRREMWILTKKGHGAGKAGIHLAPFFWGGITFVYSQYY